jgi:leucyl-tRNA---protein transferase
VSSSPLAAKMTTNNPNTILKECALHEPCSYISGNTQSIHYKVIQECSKEQCEALILRGWRRFGSMYFRPICQECRACESLKIDVERYPMKKSDRRILRKNAHLSTVIRQPTLTREHLSLFERYHRYKHHTRDWDAPKMIRKTTTPHLFKGMEILDLKCSISKVKNLSPSISSIF